jgi:hypothetical protein
MFVFHLIAGYKGSGKDSFYEYLTTNDNQKLLKFKMINFLNEEFLKCGSFYLKKHYRIGLADQVKNLVHEELGIKFKDQATAELAKENLLFYDKISKVHRNLRSYYIEKGMIMRGIDPDFWCNYAYKNIIKSIPDSESEETHIFITDWRFENEKTFFESYGKVITYRVFRTCSDNNDYSQESEHSLDKVMTDYLIGEDDYDLLKAREKFPQYHKSILNKFLTNILY